MPFQSVPATASAEVVWQYNTTPVENTFYFRATTGSYTQGSLQTLADVVDTWVGVSMKPLVGAALTYLRTEVRGLQNENDFLVSDSTSTGAGTRAGTLQPLNASMSIKRTSINTGRSARGRIYTFGLVNTDLVTGDVLRLTTAYQTAWLSALSALTTNTILVAWTPVIVSRFHNGVKRTTGVTFDLFQWIAVNNDLDSRRDRLIEG